MVEDGDRMVLDSHVVGVQIHRKDLITSTLL